MNSRRFVATAALVLLSTAAASGPGAAPKLAWREFTDVKGCNGNWYQVERARGMQQCLANGELLRCTPQEMAKICWRQFGHQQGDSTRQPAPY
jgi:hypothetical protein